MNITEQEILRIRLRAAHLEYEASKLRLDTARHESESAQRTLAMADAVASAMYKREMGPQN